MARFVEVELAKTAADFEFVFVDVVEIRPAAIDGGAVGLAAAGQGGIAQAGNRRDVVHQWGAALDDLGVGDGRARRDVRKAALLLGRVLLGDLDLFDAADLRHEIAHAVRDAGGQGKGGEQAGDAEDDAEHGEDAAEFVRADFLQPHEEGEPELHGEKFEIRISKSETNSKGGQSGKTEKQAARSPSFF